VDEPKERVMEQPYGVLGGGGVIALGFFLTVGLTVYFLPWIVAWVRAHHMTGTIFVINFLAGWTFIGWVAAMAMAASPTREAEEQGRAPVPPAPPAPVLAESVVSQLERLAALKESGALTGAEYEAAKARLLDRSEAAPRVGG